MTGTLSKHNTLSSQMTCPGIMSNNYSTEPVSLRVTHDMFTVTVTSNSSTWSTSTKRLIAWHPADWYQK